MELFLEERLEFEIDPALQEQLQKHPGEWVAMSRHDLIAHGASPLAVLKEAEEAGVDHPILYRVPTGESVYFF